jgi:uncharacterized membrane protein (TIGR02234 family)
VRSPRREYLGVLLLGAVGAVLVLVAVRQDWARVLTIQPRPLPASTAVVRGQDLLPAVGALGLAALAGLAALVATRGLARRVVGGVLAAFGVAIIVSLSMPVTDAQVRGAVTGTAGTASSVAGGSTVGGGTTPGGGVSGISLSSHVTMAAFPWRWVAVAAALLIVAAGLLAAWRGNRWPVMSSRYDRPASQPATRRPDAADPAALWESLSQGIDPTVLARGDAPPDPPITASRRAAAPRRSEGDGPPDPPDQPASSARAAERHKPG